jgi:hypothetical protein
LSTPRVLSSVIDDLSHRGQQRMTESQAIYLQVNEVSVDRGLEVGKFNAPAHDLGGHGAQLGDAARRVGCRGKQQVPRRSRQA